MRITGFILDTVFPPRETEVLVRDLCYEELSMTLSPVLRGDGTQSVISLFPYVDAFIQACILEAKFEDNQYAAELLGNALHEFLYEFLGGRTAFDIEPPILVPLPLYVDRLQERGYNQTKRIIEAALMRGLPAVLEPDLLIRTRPTKPQTSLTGRARRSNVAGAFAVTRPCDPHRTYIVVDDVITTGNTMLAACEALRAGGSKRLLPLTLAY